MFAARRRLPKVNTCASGMREVVGEKVVVVRMGGSAIKRPSACGYIIVAIVNS